MAGLERHLRSHLGAVDQRAEAMSSLALGIQRQAGGDAAERPRSQEGGVNLLKKADPRYLIYKTQTLPE